MVDEKMFHMPGASKWRSLSENELLAYEFTSADPESLENLSEEVPANEEPEIEAVYDMAGRAQKVRCVHCKYPNHYKGIVVRYPSGVRNLVGRDCALIHHGVEFKQMLVDFDAGIERQSYGRRRRALLLTRAAVAEAFNELNAHPSINSHDNLQQRWWAIFEELAIPLANIAKRDELLFVNRHTRDEGAERERKEKLGDRFEGERQKAKALNLSWQLFKNVRENVGPLGGGLFFSSRHPVRRRIAEIQAEIQQTFRLLSSEELKTSQIRDSLNKMRDLRDAIAHEFDHLGAVLDAFHPENLARIARWANEEAAEQTKYEAMMENRKAEPIRDRWSAVGSSLTNRKGDERTIHLPANYRIPRRTLLDVLTKAISIDHEPT